MRKPVVAGVGLLMGTWLGCQREFDCDAGTVDCICAQGSCDDGLVCENDTCIRPADASNMLSNASFEDWAGDNPLSWERTTDAWEQTQDDAHHGESAVRLTASDYSDISQIVVLENPLPAGTQFTGEAYARYVEGDTTQPFLSLQLTYDGGEEERFTNSFPSFGNGNWVKGSVGGEATQEVVEITLFLDVAQGGTPQTADFDSALLRVVE